VDLLGNRPAGRALRVPILLVCILVAGAALRAGYLSEIRSAPFFAAPAVDAGFHDYWARGIATGDWQPPHGSVDPQVYARPYFRPPGYPYFLGGIYAISGGGYLAPRVVQMTLGMANVVLLFSLARRWFGSAVALVGSALMATHWIPIYFEGELHAPVLLIFLLLSTLLLLGRWRAGPTLPSAVGAGFTIGLASLVRPNALAIGAVSLLWMAWIVRRGTPPRASWVHLPALALAIAVAVLPVTVRNYRVSGELVPISSNLGINLYIGNNERADGLVATEIDDLGSFRTCFDWPALVDRLERKLGRELGDAEVSRYFSGRALEFVRRQPGRAARLTARKAALFWGPAEVGHNKEIHYERLHSAVLSKLPLSFPLLLAAAVVGCVLLLIKDLHPAAAPGGTGRTSTGRTEITVLLVAWVAIYFLSVLPFFAAARYRVPILPILVILASVAVVRLAGALRRREVRNVATTGLAFAAVYLVVSHAFVDYEPSLARWHYDRGTDFDRVGDADRAQREYERAVELRPDFFEARYNLGHQLADRGRVEEAIEQWRIARRLHPGFAPVHYNLAHAFARQGSSEQAIESMARAVAIEPDSWIYQTEQGDLLASVGRVDEAVAHYRAALAVRETYVPALRNLSLLLAFHPDPQRRDPAEAVRLAERAAALTNESSTSVLDALGAAYASAGRTEQALRVLRRAYELARESGQDGLAEKIRQRAESYAREEAGPD
jgi:tetratricopeptide (TPR) repeat protein/4-amino-4-deoxy-L-arabinose transferase-like glycosyltransferase